MNKDTDNQSSSINTKISVCFSILIISIIILIFCDTDTACSLCTYLYTFIFVSISYLFLEYKKTKQKSGGFVEKIELFKYSRDDIESEKVKLLNQNVEISKIMDKYDGFERYNKIESIHKNVNNVDNVDANNVVSFKGLNDLNMEELDEEGTDLLRVTRTDFIPIGLKKILLSKINNKLSFSDGVIKRIIESNKWAPDAKMFNQNFITTVKKAYLDSKKGLSYINSKNISERLLNEEYLLRPDFSSELKTNINMLERDKILNDEILSQCGKLLYSMLAHNQIIKTTMTCTDYYFNGKLMSEADDESLEKNILLHSQLVKFFENITIENIDNLVWPDIGLIKCNVEKTGSSEKYGGVKLTIAESNELAVLAGAVRRGLKPKEQERMNQLLNKQKSKAVSNSATNKSAYSRPPPSKQVVVKPAKDIDAKSDSKYMKDSKYMEDTDAKSDSKYMEDIDAKADNKPVEDIDVKEDSKPVEVIDVKEDSKPVEVIDTKADSKTSPNTNIEATRKTSKYSNSSMPEGIKKVINTSPSSNPATIRRPKTKVISTVESIKKVENISEDNFKNGIASNERILLEDKITSESEDKSMLSKFLESVTDSDTGINVFSRNLILRRPAVLLLNRTYLGDKTNPFDGELQAKNYNEFREKIYRILVFNVHDLHLRLMAHFISNKKRLLDLTSIDDKCLERINKIGEKVKTLEEEMITANGIKDELAVLKLIEKEANELRGAKYELEAKLKEEMITTNGMKEELETLKSIEKEVNELRDNKSDLEAKLKEALAAKASWKVIKDLEEKTDELEKTLSEKQKSEEKIKELIQKNSELMISSAESRSESNSLTLRLKNASDVRNSLEKENKDKDVEIINMKDKIEDLNTSLEYLRNRENRIISETKFSDKILRSINSGRMDVRKIINIVEKLKGVVADKYESNKDKLLTVNKKVSGTIDKLQKSMTVINMLAERTSVINSFYSKDKIKKNEKLNENVLNYKSQISDLNIQMKAIQELLKPFFISNGTGFEYLKQHLENLNNEKSLIKEELSKINFSIISNELNSKDINFAEFVGKYNNELNIQNRIKLFKRLSDIDTKLYNQYQIVERYNQFVDKVFKEFKKVEPVNKDFLFENNEFLKEYQFLALNYRNYILKHNKVIDLNTTLLSKNSILTRRLNELSLENKILSDTISSKEPDKLIITIKDEIVRLNAEIDKYYKNNSSCVQDLEELKQNLNQSMLENSDLKDTILNLEKEMEFVKIDYKTKLESAIDNYATELNSDLDTMVILLNGSNNVDWSTNNVEISNTKKKQLFIISKIKELLLSNDNNKNINIELEKMKKTIKSLNEEAERKNIVITELRESISSGDKFINSSGVMSSSNTFKTNSELYEEEKLNMQENIKLLETDKKRILEDLDYLQSLVEKSNKESRETIGNVSIVSKSIAKASDYMATPLGFHTKNALNELFKCISSNSIKRILFHKLFKGFFTKKFVVKFNIQENLNLNIENIGDTNIFSEDALNEIYNYTTDDEGKETDIYTDIFSNYLKKIYSSKSGEKEGRAEEDEISDDVDDIDDIVEYTDYETEPDRWDYDDDEEYKKAVELFNKKKENKGMKNEVKDTGIEESKKDTVVNTVTDTTVDNMDVDTTSVNMDAKLIFLLVLDKLNIINKESKYYKNVILPLFNKYKMQDNIFNDEKFVKECFDNIDNDTDNYIKNIRNLNFKDMGLLTRSIIQSSKRDTEKISSLLSLGNYIDVVDEKDLVASLYSLDKYENIEMDYLLAIIILDIKNYESISKQAKIIQSKLDNAIFMIRDVEKDLINSIIPKVSHLNKNYFSIMDSLKSIIFKDNSRAESFIKRKLNQLSKKGDYNKFDEIQAIIITKLKEDFDSLNNEIKEFETNSSLSENVNSNLYNTKGLLQVYQDRVLEISSRLQLYSSNVKEITSSISDNINKIKSDKERLNKANNEILKLNKFNQELNVKLSILMNKEQANLTEVNSLNESLEKINYNITKSVNDKSTASSSISSLDKSINDTNIRLKEYNNYIQQLDKKVNELSSIEIGRNRINEEIKTFIMNLTPDINDNTALGRLQIIKQKLDDNLNTVREKEDEKLVLTNLNNGLAADRDRIISDINNLLNESINSDDKQWMNDMDSIGIKLDIINKFIEKWENNGNEKIRDLIELLQKNKQISAELITKLNTDISDISDIDFIIQKIKPYIKKPEDLAVRYDSELIKNRDELEKAINQKNLLEKEVSGYVLDRRNKIIFINTLDIKLRNYINENNSLKTDMNSILSNYSGTIKEKEELNIRLGNLENEINSKNLEILRLGEEIQKQKDTIFEMSKTIERMESSSKSTIDKNQCSAYIKGVIDPIIETLSDDISSIKEITKIAEFISNRWSKGNLDISTYIQKNKILEEEIKRISNVNIEYERNIAEFKTSKETLKNLTMILKLFTNKSDKTILEQLKLNNLNSFDNSQELEKYLNAKIDLSTEIIKGFKSVVNNYESIRNILKDKDLAANISNIISKCNEYKKILASKNMEKIETVNEILLSKEELEVKINELENQLSIILIEKNKQLVGLKGQIRDDEYIDIEISKIIFDSDNDNSIYVGDIKYVQTIINLSESIIKKENTDGSEKDIIEIFKSNLEGMLILSKKYLSEEEHNMFNNLYNNLTIVNIVDLNPLIKTILRNIMKKNSDDKYESKKNEILADVIKYNKDINDKITKTEATFKSDILSISDKLDRYKLLFLKASDGIKKYTNDINKSSEIIDDVRNKIIRINLELDMNKQQIDEILNDKRKAIELNKKLKTVETITIGTANTLQSNIDSYNKDIIKIQIYLRKIVDYTKNLKEGHAKIIDELLSSKDKSDEEKQEAINKYNQSLETIETTDKALKEFDYLDKEYKMDRDLSINQLKTDLIEAKKLLDVSLIDLDKFSGVVKRSIDYIYESIQEINLISALTGKLKENINRKLAIKDDANIINYAVKDKEIYDRIIKDFKSPIEKQILQNKLLVIDLNSIQGKVDYIAKKYKDSIIKKSNSHNSVCKKETNTELRIVEEIIYVDRNNNIIMPNSIIVDNVKKVKEPVTDYDKYKKQLTKQ
jgi:hypothetical protein